jgi:hypothetical protein
LSGGCGALALDITYHMNKSTMKLSWTITITNISYVCSGGWGMQKNGTTWVVYTGALPSVGNSTTFNDGPVDVTAGWVIDTDFRTSYTVPAGCGTQTIDWWVDNRTGTSARIVKFASVEGSTVTPIPVSASVNAGTAVSIAANTETTVAIGSVVHFTASGSYCGTLKMYEKTGDGVFVETESDPSVAVESREPDPAPIPLPTITDPSTASVASVPSPSAAFPQRVTDGGMTEDRWTKGILDVLRASGSGTVVMAENSKTIAQAAAYDAARLQNIDANIALLTRNSNEERADRTANYARFDAIKNNTKAAADALKDDPTIAQKHFADVADPAHHTDLTDTLVKGLASRMPNAPAVTLPTNQSTFSMTFTPPGLTETQTVSFDLSAYDTGINVFKIAVRAALTVAFFFLTVKTLRSAFAG